MTTYRDVHVDLLLDEVVRAFESNSSIKAPNWAHFAKTGRGRQRSPDQADWWSRRCAAVLRKVAMDGPIGTNHLAQAFGSTQNRGVWPNAAASGSRSVVRKALQQLEDAGLVSKVHSKIIEVDDGDGNLEEVQLYRGRIISPQGQKLLDECAHAARPQAEARAPSLERY